MTTILTFGDWWKGLGSFVQVFFIIAASSSLILLIQLIIAMFGFGEHDVGDTADEIGGDADGGTDGSAGDPSHGVAGMRLFTVQTIISFLVTFGWSGVLFGSWKGIPEWLAFILALLIGTVTLFGMAKLMQIMMKLQQSGNIDVRNAVGLMGEVYIPVPASEGGMGKVNITVQGRLGEYNAVTKGAELLKTGTQVKVIDVRDGTLIVEKEAAKAETKE